MNRKDKNKEKSGKEMIAPADISLSINYGDVVASVKADKDTYVAQITGKMGEGGEWPYHKFVMRFIKSIERACNINEQI